VVCGQVNDLQQRVFRCQMHGMPPWMAVPQGDFDCPPPPALPIPTSAWTDPHYRLTLPLPDENRPRRRGSRRHGRSRSDPGPNSNSSDRQPRIPEVITVAEALKRLCYQFQGPRRMPPGMPIMPHLPPPAGPNIDVHRGPSRGGLPVRSYSHHDVQMLHLVQPITVTLHGYGYVTPIACPPGHQFVPVPLPQEFEQARGQEAQKENLAAGGEKLKHSKRHQARRSRRSRDRRTRRGHARRYRNSTSSSRERMMTSFVPYTPKPKTKDAKKRSTKKSHAAGGTCGDAVRRPARYVPPGVLPYLRRPNTYLRAPSRPAEPTRDSCLQPAGCNRQFCPVCTSDSVPTLVFHNRNRRNQSTRTPTRENLTDQEADHDDSDEDKRRHSA
jgi:hypothetical protein